MRVYLDLVIVLNFAVDFLLLLGAAKLSGFPSGIPRAAAAAAFGAAYAGACLVPGFRFLGNLLWRGVSLGIMGTIAYGMQRSALRRTVLFVLLSMALGGIALGLGNGGFFALIAAAAGVCVLCILGFQGKAGGATYVPVEVCCGKTRLRITALRDTGNGLTDPITGQSVMVLGADASLRLTGLTQKQLASPVETMAEGNIPGLRLISYRAVGQPGGMLLAMRMDNVKIGTRHASTLVAFAPHELSNGGAYQALTGGAE